MRWNDQQLDLDQGEALPGMSRLSGFVRSVTTPEFAGITFHEVLARSGLNHVPGSAKHFPMGWTINPYRGCSHGCTYCFARPTHSYLDFDTGRDFDEQIVVKVNVADVVRREVSRPSWNRDHVALGTNTDPYQRAEGRYRLMPGIIEALAGSDTSFSILTKGTLLRRDLPVLREAAERVSVGLSMSIAVFDPVLQQSVEPGTPTAQARLETVAAAREAGFSPTVFLMPVMPYLTDSTDHLREAVRSIAAAGAGSALYSVLHLRGEVKPWFLAWLGRERPDLVPLYEQMYSRSAYAPREYRRWLAGRIKPLLRRYGLARSGSRSAPTTAEVPPAAAAVLQPSLF